MVSLYDILIISLIVLVVFLIICVHDIRKLVRNLQGVVDKNKQPLENILSDVSKLTNETVSLEEKVKNYLTDLLLQFINK